MPATEPAECSAVAPPGTAVEPGRGRAVTLDFGLCILGLALGLWFFPLQVMGTDLGRLPGDAMDGRFNNYVLEHGYRYLNGDEPSFWNMPTFYPVPRTTALSDCHLGTLPIYAGFRSAGYDRETSYQLWWLTILGCNYLIAYSVLRSFGLTPLGSMAGATIFAFGMPIQTMIGHLQVFPRFGVPLAFYWSYRFLGTGRTRYFLGTGLALVWQMYATIYVGYFLALALFGFLIVAVIFHRRELVAHVLRANWKSWVVRIAVAGLCGVPMAYLAKTYADVAHPEMYQENLTYIRWHLPSATAWLTPTPQSELWGARADLLPPIFHSLFPGTLALLGFVVAFIPACWSGTNTIRRLSLAAVASVSLLFVLTLNLGDDSPYLELARLPGIAAIRAVDRIIIVALFPFGLLAAGLVSRLELAFGNCGRNIVGLVVACSITAFGVIEQKVAPDLSYTLNKAEMQQRSARMAERIRAIDPEARSAVLIVNWDEQNVATFVIGQLDMMMATQSLGIATPNGYSGHNPPEWIMPQSLDDVQHWMLRAGEHQFQHLVVLESDSSRGFALGNRRITRMESALAPKDCRSKLETLDSTGPWATAQRRQLRVRVTNESQAVWRARECENSPDRFRIYVGYRWTTRERAAVDDFGFEDRIRTFLNYDIDPASSDELTLQVDTPLNAGNYVLELSTGQVANAWFHTVSSHATLKIPVEIRQK